jgi:hypothetical protein
MDLIIIKYHNKYHLKYDNLKYLIWLGGHIYHHKWVGDFFSRVFNQGYWGCRKISKHEKSLVDEWTQKEARDRRLLESFVLDWNAPTWFLQKLYKHEASFWWIDLLDWMGGSENYSRPPIVRKGTWEKKLTNEFFNFHRAYEEVKRTLDTNFILIERYLEWKLENDQVLGRELCARASNLWLGFTLANIDPFSSDVQNLRSR